MSDQEKNELVSFEYSDLMKSNLLIGAKYKASLMELRVTYAALFMLQNNKYKEESDGFYVSMYPAELKKFLGVEGHSIYEALEPVARSMTNRSIGFSDPINKTFDYINLISRARYEDGVFTVKFNRDMQDYIINLKSNFTNLSRLTMMSFTSAYSFRLYELLKQQCFYPRIYHGERNNIFSYNVGLSELKFNLGVINAELDEVRKILSSGTKPDYEKAEAKSPEKITSYGNWSNFRAKCLDVAVNEINNSKESDIHVEYKPVRVGRGGKVKAIDFTIYLNGAEGEAEAAGNIQVTAPDQEVEILDETAKFKIQYEILQELSSYNVKIADVISICNEAHYNKEEMLHAIQLLRNQSNEVSNVTGWLITAIKKHFESTVDGSYTDQKTANKPTGSADFGQFEHRQYNFEEMESSIFQAKQED